MQYESAPVHALDNLTHPQVYRLFHAIEKRDAILHDLRTATITVGDHVEVVGKIGNARYATGLSGTVQAIYDDKFADLLLDEKSTTALAGGNGRNAHPDAADTDRYLFTGMPLSACRTVDPDASFVEVVGFLFAQATLEDLQAMTRACKQRMVVLGNDLEVGDTVMLANIERKYLAGLTGTVQAVHPADKRFSLLLDESSTDRLRNHSRNNRIDIPRGTKEYLLPQIATACAVITTKR